MNCPFCHIRLYCRFDNSQITKGELIQWKDLHCINESCWVDGEFPRYKCSVAIKGEDGLLLSENFALDNLYVQCNSWAGTTTISKLKHCALIDEVVVPRLIWLNVKNFEATLDKLKIMVTFS